MDRIFFENIRCFASRQEARLAPLTVLVGENSSGKSTFLALVRLAWQLVVSPHELVFNEEPFELGAYDQIVSVSGARPKSKNAFLIGMRGRAQVARASRAAAVTGRFVEHLGQPFLESWSWESMSYKITINFPRKGDLGTLVVAGPSGQFAGRANISTLEPHLLPVILMSKRSLKPERKLPVDAKITAEELAEIYRLFEAWLVSFRILRPHAFAPTRTRPKRTYDPVQPLESPEGSHIPMILSNTIRRDPEVWSKIAAAMESFGRQSGLFDRVEARHLGKLDSDPFQIQIRLGGSARNLVDVGYGVSQVLPIIVDCLRGERGGTFLLQQPEVHLHPSAQAEMGSFLGVLAKEQNKCFVIETHSDYLVDRIRMDIRDRKGITPEDVSLLYFERRNGEAHIHELALDDQGNILDPPPGYRSFFLEEERRLLGG